jgi:hypothetical protein
VVVRLQALALALALVQVKVRYALTAVKAQDPRQGPEVPAVV